MEPLRFFVHNLTAAMQAVRLRRRESSHPADGFLAVVLFHQTTLGNFLRTRGCDWMCLLVGVGIEDVISGLENGPAFLSLDEPRRTESR